MDDSSYLEFGGGEVKNHSVVPDSESIQVGSAVDAPQFLEIASSGTRESLERVPNSISISGVEIRELLLGVARKKNLPFHGRSSRFLHPFSTFKIEYCSSMKST